jgi:hypothetical protein
MYRKPQQGFLRRFLGLRRIFFASIDDFCFEHKSKRSQENN